MAFNKSERPDAPARRRGGMRRRKKVCVFCGKDNVIEGKGEEIFRIHCQYEEGRGDRGNRKSDQTGRTA